jgi:predicted alpha/beta hydrolase family esterase
MTKTHILFIHGGGDDGYTTDSKLADSLQQNLGDNYIVLFPHMPTPDSHSAQSWPKKIHEAIATAQPTFLVGHSFGASNMLQYLVHYAGTVATPRRSGRREALPLLR